VSIRVKFGSSKEKITTQRIYIYLIPDTYFLTVSFSAIFPYKNPYPESSTGQAVA